MSVNEIRCETAVDFWKYLTPKKSNQNYLYRGQAVDQWSLTPSIFRNNLIIPLGGNADKQVFFEILALKKFIEYCDDSGVSIPNDSRSFREQYINLGRDSLINKYLVNSNLWPDKNLYELMGFAQHFGLPTRMLDWTTFPYVSAYFAASDALKRDNDDESFCVWILNGSKINLYPNVSIQNIPKGANKNIVAQHGCFTVLKQGGSRDKPFQGSNEINDYLDCEDCESPLTKIILSSRFALEILELCELFKISGASVYPGEHGAVLATMDYMRMAKREDSINEGR